MLGWLPTEADALSADRTKPRGLVDTKIFFFFVAEQDQSPG